MHRVRVFALLVLSLGAATNSVAKEIASPSGWSVDANGSQRVLTKGTSRIVIGPWESLQGQSIEQWLDARKSIVPGGVEFVSVGKIKKETGGSSEYYYVTQKIKIKGKSGSGSVLACPGKEGVVRLQQMHFAARNFLDAMSAGTWLDRVCTEEPKGSVVTSAGTSQQIADSPSTVSGQTRSPAIAGERVNSLLSTDALPPVNTLDGLKEVRGVIVYGIQAGGMFGTTEDFIALFEDGTYSSDLPRTFGVSKAASKKKKPNYWGTWRFRNDKLELKDFNDRAFDTTSGDWVADGGKNDQRLTGCYGNITSTSGADYTSGTTVGLARSWCFYPNGRFTNKASAYGSSSNPGVAMGVSNKARGRYRIDGNMARFVYDDGHEVISAFGFINKDRTHIMLNGKRFMGKKNK